MIWASGAAAAGVRGGEGPDETRGTEMSGMTTEGAGRLTFARGVRALVAMLLAAAALSALCASALASPAGAGLQARPFATLPPKVTQQPSNTSVEAGSPASFTSAASNSPTVQWELSTDGGGTWQPIEGATSGTYTIPATTLAESGHEVRAVFTNAGGSATSKAATLTVTSRPVITQQPVDATVQQGKEASFEARAIGNPTPTVQWEQSTDGGATYKRISGATSDVLHFGIVGNSEDGWKFRAVFKNTKGEATTEVATLHVVEAPVVTIQPSDTTVIEGENASFKSTARGAPAPTVQWEVSTDGGGSWQPIEGATADELVVPTTFSENGYRYRAVFTNNVGSTPSSAAKLTVLGKPVVTLQPEDQTVAVGGTASFEATGGGSPAPTVQWELSANEGASWTPVAGATADKLTISNAQLSESGREYRAVFKNSAGSTASNAALLTVSAVSYQGYGWGLNAKGQTGTGSTETMIPSPRPIPGLRFVTAVAAGDRHSLALLAGGSVEAWGFNGYGQLGNEGADQTSPIPVAGVRHAKAIAAGGNHSVALLRNGTVMTWGDDESGQLGNGEKTEYVATPAVVPGLGGVTAIAAGQEHTLALLANGTVMAWGGNERGQLGAGGATSTVPVPVKGLSEVVAIAADRNFSMALLANGTVMAWGDDEHGQLGNAAQLEKAGEEGHFSKAPIEVEGLSGVTAIAAGTTHALALLSNKTVVAWGDDREGQLGNGATEPMAIHPVSVSGLTGVTSIEAGESDSAATIEHGTLETWGANSQGSLGLGTHGAAVSTPTQVTALGMVAGVSAGGGQMIAFGEELPTLTGISPSSGPTGGGTEVTITGTNLSGATSVHFGAAAATSFKAESPSTVTAIAPAGTGTVDVTVTTPTGTTPLSGADRFAYVPAPVVTKLSAKGGPATGGTTVTITGSNLAGATEVRFGSAAATIGADTATSITVVTPAGAGTVPVTVTTAGGTSAPAPKAQWRYGPAIESITPSSGPLAGGGTVTIAGAGFAAGTNTTKFKFGATKSKSAECTATSCTVLVPAGRAAGTVDVIASVPKAKSAPVEADRYTYE